MSPTRRRLGRLRRWLLTGVASLLVLAAGLIAVGRLLLPWLVDSPDTVAQWLSQRIGRAVELDGVQARWDGAGPTLELEGLRIAAEPGGPAAITLGKARVQVDIYGALPGRQWIRDFLLVDATLDLVREADGRIAPSGFTLAQPGAVGLSAWLSRVGHIGLTGGRLRLHDRASARTLELDAVELRLSQQGELLSVGLDRHSADGGRLHVVLQLPGGWEQPRRHAELYWSAEAFPLAELSGIFDAFGIGVREGILEGQQWLRWGADSWQDGFGDWRMSGLVVAAPEFPWLDGAPLQPNLHLPQGRVLLRGSVDGNSQHWDLSLGTDPDELSSVMSVRWRPAASRLTLAADALPVELISGLLQLLQPIAADLRARVYAANPEGELRDLRLDWEPDRWQVHGDASDLTLHSMGAHLPGFAGLDLSYSADPEGGVVALRSDAVELTVPGVFRNPIALSTLTADLGYSRPNGVWRLQAPAVQVVGEGFSVSMSGQLDLDPDLGPVLQLQAHVPGADIQAAKAFWVVNKMPPRTVAWLDHALGAGRVSTGDVVLRGPLRQWPFREQQGRLEARFAVDGATLDYHPDWPSAEDLSAAGAFINSSLVIETATGRLVGNRVVRGSGGIASLKDPILTLDLAGEGDSTRWLNLLKASPLRRNFGETLFGMAMDGPADVGVQLVIPLKKELGTTTLEGQALLRGVHFVDTKWDLDFEDVHGRADFSERGFAADRLTLLAGGHPAELALAVGAFCADASQQVEASLRGVLSTQALFGHHDELATLLAQTSGAAPWTVQLAVARSPIDGRAAGAVVNYASNLEGIAVNFPAPLGKAPSAVLPLRLSVKLPPGEAAPTLQLDLDQIARLYADIGTRTQPFRGELQFGTPQPVDLPSKGLRVSGQAAALDLAGWTGWVYASADPGGEESVLTDVDVRIGSDQPDRLRLDRSDGPWVLRMDGPSAKGSVRFESPAQGPAAIVAQFEKLYLPEPGDGVGELAITPRMVPTLHLWAGDLRIGDAQLGEARLEAFAMDGGLRVDLLEARSPDLEIHAKGEWIDAGGGAASQFKIRMTSENLGRMLTGLGFAGVIEGGQTLAEIDARWQGAPYAFSLDRVNGTIDVSVGHGRFLDVDPGAGRIFGLLSLRELPRRLTLDFRDLFQSGMSFDRIEGRFELSDGNAWTDNLTVRSPAADVLIIGRTGLASRDYDQQVMVAPHMSGMLPVIGGLAAGPVGAAAGFLAQGVVQGGSDIEKSSRVHYSIAGSWERPVVARLTPVRPDAPPKRRQEDG